MIEYKNISRSYNGRNIIEDFNLTVEQGEFVTIVGSSGSGKTTILKMVNGLIAPTSGEILIGGCPIAQQDIIELSLSICYAVQGSVLFPHLTVEQNIAYVPHLKGEKNSTDNIIHWIEAVGLNKEMLERYPSELSGGEQQRVGIARAMITSPNIILMDEPFGAVDEITRSQLQRLIKELHTQSGATILFVTHDISEALYLGTKTLILNSGKVEQFATPSHIMTTPASKYVRSLIKYMTNKKRRL